jgi:hypothetical protein
MTPQRRGDDGDGINQLTENSQMPNHVLNELIFCAADASEQERIISILCGDDGKVDFQKLVPVPNNVWQFSVGADHERAFKQTALDWCRENWGTKWNAYSHKPIERTESTIAFVFETAWRPPYGWLVAVFNTLKRGFEHRWIDEGGPEAIGLFQWPKEDMDQFKVNPWTERKPTDEEHRRLHKVHWGVEKFEDDMIAEVRRKNFNMSTNELGNDVERMSADDILQEEVEAFEKALKSNLKRKEKKNVILQISEDYVKF